MRRRQSQIASVCALAIFLSGCSGDLAGSLSANAVTGYQAASAFAPTGHSVTTLDDNRVRVTASGSAATPVDRVQKIALARAAEYGVESGHKFFKTEPPQQSIRCGKKQTSVHGQTVKLPAKGYLVVDIDVSYAKDAADPSYRSTKDAAAALMAEIAAEAPTAESQAAAKAAVDAQCGV